MDYRAGQGLRAGLATFEDACDLLTGGVRTPEAIRALLQYAAATWAVAPRMVVLAGSGHYDYLGINYAEANHLPPMLVQMPAGVCASDGLLADTGGDDLPDLAIGRLPALTAEELTAMIAKIKVYEAGFGAEWQNQLVLAADNADAAGQFLAANQRLADLVAAPYSVAERIELGPMTYGAARTNLLRWFNVGAGFINYVGHGDIKNLAAEKLLKDTDVAAMVNTSRPPVVATLTCLAARYEVPAVHSLGERLLRRAGGGAVAVLGPSGLSQNAPATELGEAFYRAILQDGSGELGPAFLRARRSLPESLFTKDTIAVYNLLGDPALKIAGNDPADESATPAQVSLAGLAQTYDGTPRAATATSVPAGLAIRLSYDGQLQAPTAAGTYAVCAAVATVGYEGFATGTLVVAKAPAAVTLSDLTQVYDGTPRVVAAATVPAGLAVEWSCDGAAELPVGAGIYEVAATVADANFAGSATGTLVVAKAPAAVTLSGLAQVYDGTPKAASAATVPAGLAVEWTYAGAAPPPVAAGTYEIVATIADADYAGAVTGTLIVAKASAGIVLGDLQQACDGTPRHATATTDPALLAVDFTYDGRIAAPTKAGTYAVAATIGDANYSGSATGTLEVVRGAATVALGDLAHVFDGSPKGATVTSVPAGLPVRVTYDGWETPPSAAGTYEVVATVVSADFTGSAVGTLAILDIIDPFERWLETQSLDPQDTRFVWDEDGDGDGQTTWEEYLADTDPEDPDDLFAVEGTYSEESGSILMTFPTSPDRYYQLEYSTNLFAPVQVKDLGWGTDGTYVTNAPGQWFGTIRVRMDPP